MPRVRGGDGPAVAVSGGGQSGRTREVSLRVAAGLVAGTAAAVIVWACALPLVIIGSTSFSIFKVSHPIWPAVEPVGVAVLGLCAGIVMIAWHGSGLRRLAAGVLLASGTQTVLYFVDLRFGGIEGRPGSASAVGITGGVMLVAAGVLGALSSTAGPAAAAGGPTPSARAGARMRVAAGISSAAGVVLIIWAFALPSFTFRGTPISFFSGLVIADSFEPTGVAVLGVCAGLVMITVSSGSGLRWLTAGMLAASGAQTWVFFASRQFRPLAGPAYGPGSASVVGMIGAVLLAAAGVLGAVSSTAGRVAATAVADGASCWTPPQPYVPGPDGDIPAGIRGILWGYAGIGSAAILGGAGFLSASLYQPASTTWSGVTTPAIQHPVLLVIVALIGLALGVAGAMVLIQRSRFSRLVRRPGDPSRATVTASRPGGRLALDAPCGGYLPELDIRLAWGTEPQIPSSGQSVTLYGRPGGVGPVLLSASDPGEAYLGTARRRTAVSASRKTPDQADEAAGTGAAPEDHAEPRDT